MRYLQRYFINKSLLNNFGYTLVEISIVVIIIGIMVAIALPDFNKTIGRYNLDKSARELALDIRSLQQSAIKNEDTGFKIQFINTNTYRLAYFSVTQKTVKLPSGVKLDPGNTSLNITGNSNTLEFAATGRPFGGVGGHFSLKDQATGKSLYVIISTLGRVRVSETPP